MILTLPQLVRQITLESLVTMLFYEGADPQSGFPVLDLLGWATGPADALTKAAKLLADPEVSRPGLTSWYDKHRRWFAALDDRSVYRVSHNKWFLGESAPHYQVWLHEYHAVASLPNGRGSFAASVHNHRYDFCSRVLSGRLVVEYYDLVDDWPVNPTTEVVEAGQVYTLAADRVHRVVDVADGTMTCVVQAWATRSRSTVYDLAHHRRHSVGSSRSERGSLLRNLPGVGAFS